MNKSVWIQKKLQESLQNNLDSKNINFNDYINQLIEYDLKKEIIKNKKTRENYYEDLCNLQEQIQKHLYKVFFKRNKKEEFYIDWCIKYLGEKRDFIDDLSKSITLIEWIDKQILLLQEHKIEELDCNIPLRDKNYVQYCKQKYGKKFGDIE